MLARLDGPQSKNNKKQRKHKEQTRKITVGLPDGWMSLSYLGNVLYWWWQHMPEVQL
jgi:hypothetical protein